MLNFKTSFSILLKFPRGRKTPLDFRIKHAQSWNLKNRAKKDGRKKSWKFSTFLVDLSKT